MRVPFQALAVVLLVNHSSLRATDPATSEVLRWRASHDGDVLGPDGPFTLVARFTPQKGLSSIGRDASNSLIIPVPTAPLRVGTIEWDGGDAATLRIEPGVAAFVDGKAVSEVAIAKPANVRIGELIIRARFRDAVLRVSVQEPDALKRRRATTPVWFPVDLRYRLSADWIASPQPKMIRIPDSDGGSRKWKSPGYASFVLDGEPIKLQAVLTPDGKQLSFFFRDATAGQETYGAGRFLETDLPQDGKVILDFNEAYNPFCNYNPLYVCPIPPPENHIPLRIPAGERKYPHPADEQ